MGLRQLSWLAAHTTNPPVITWDDSTDRARMPNEQTNA